MPIPGIIASQISGHLTPPDTGAMFPLGMVSVGSAGAANITFSSIPSTYKHLQIRWIGRGTFSDVSAGQKVNFNSDTGSNYPNHLLRGNGTSVFADGAASQTAVSYLGRVAAATSTSGIFGGFVMDILDYASTSKYKTIRCLGGADLNGSGEIRLTSGAWMSTSAITSMTFQITDGGNYTQYTQFALYGIL